MDLTKIGACLRDLRKENGLTQEQLAEQFHVSQRTVSRWEAGSNMPDLDVLLQLSDFYAIDLRSLLNGERVNLKMTKETKEIVQQIVILDQEKEKRERAKRIRIWVACFLAATILNYFALAAFQWDYLPFGPLSTVSALVASAFGGDEGTWLIISIAYVFFRVALTVFTYTMTFAKGKGLWFQIYCCIDIAACLVFFLFVPYIEAGAAQWCGLGVQIFHAVLFFIINYIWKREKKTKPPIYQAT